MSTGQNEVLISKPNFSANRILYIDPYLAVFNKACGDICETCPEDLRENEKYYVPFIFIQCFKSLYGSIASAPSFVHCFNRLDRPVSGAVLLVFDRGLTTRLQKQFTERQTKTVGIKKEYRAILEGRLPLCEDFILLEHYLRFDAKKQKAFVCTENARKAKRARLLWRPVLCTDAYTLAEIELLTGRTHQIRCQLAYEGYHIKGDVKYGARRSDSLGGIRLHAFRLRFEHPVSGIPIDVCAPLLKTDNLWQACVNPCAGLYADGGFCRGKE